MKKATKLKAFMLSLIMTALLLPMTSFAQQISDSFSVLMMLSTAIVMFLLLTVCTTKPSAMLLWEAGCW